MPMSKVVYADNAATTSLSHTALSVMMPYLLGDYGNPSGAYSLGRSAKEGVETSRKVVAKCIHAAKPYEIIFTSGGTEADNQALWTAATIKPKEGKPHIITSAFEHHAVLHTLEKMESLGVAEVTYLPVNDKGLIKLSELKEAVRPNTVMVSIMFANNEVGTVQPIESVGAFCRKRGILFHTDAVQAVGHIPINVEEMKIDMLSMSGHKFRGPKGVGALYIREGCPLERFIEGGSQENGLRSGTENVAGIVGMAAALAESCERMADNMVYITRMRDKLATELMKIPMTCINGSMNWHVPGTLSLCFEGIDSEALIMKMDAEGICVSAGSACTTGDMNPSHVLTAMGVPERFIHGALRISVNEENTMTDIDRIIDSVKRNVKVLRSMSATWDW